MSGRWEFNKADPSSVRIGLTQRDQFNNDDVGLAEALVREVIQNSSDASDGSAPVKVRFNLKTLNKDEVIHLESNLLSLAPHLNACGFKIPAHESTAVRALGVEDFNTVGLTGSFEELDKGNFCNFWRAVGESEKSGQQGGRWGLGKLVYSSASRIRSFYGLTVRRGDDGPSIMGQAVLANHTIGQTHYPVHGFWFDGRSSNGLGLQLPVTDQEEIQKFRKLYGIQRIDEPGFSLVVPYLIDGITDETLLLGVINNFYFPILAGKIEVEIGDTLVNANTFLALTKSFSRKLITIPFSFVKEISDAMKSGAPFTTASPIQDKNLTPDLLSVDQLEKMKEVFAAGELVHLQVDVALQRKNGALARGKIGLFAKALAEEDEVFSLFARGPITLPRERRYTTGIMARVALIADDGLAAEFLGDAENPSHTGWNSNAEKLTDRWLRAQGTLRTIRGSLRNLYAMIAGQREKDDEDALIDFFSIADKAEGAKGKKRRVRKQNPEIERRETAIRIRPRSGGFELVAESGAQKWRYPKVIRVRMAYDMIGADPFKRFSAFDFDIRKSRQVVFQPKHGEVNAVRANILHFRVEGPDFQLRADGFDSVRDLVVDARLL